MRALGENKKWEDFNLGVTQEEYENLQLLILKQKQFNGWFDGALPVAAEPVEAGYKLPWAKLYGLIDGQLAPDELALLDLPSVTAAVPKLVSRGSLTDPSFIIAIDAKQNTEHDKIDELLKGAGALEVKHNERKYLSYE